MTVPSSYPPPSPSAAAHRAHRGRDSYDGLEPALAELAGLEREIPRRATLRAEVIGRCLPLADHIARRYAGRGVDFEDLVQIARMGAVNAVDRYDPGRGAPFLAFAVPTIMGEVRRYFRDQGWAVRIPRRLKELQAEIAHSSPRLAQELGRVPTARDLAAALGVGVEVITQAMVAANAYSCDSLDTATVVDESGDTLPSPADRLGDIDPHYALLEDAAAVRPLIAELSPSDRRVLILRYYDNRTQDQIATVLGCSQMQVSRILARVLTTLRERALAEPDIGHAA